MNEIYLNRDLIQAEEFTNEMFMCYVAIRKKYLKDRPKMYINVMSIIYELTGKLDSTRMLEDKIKIGFEQLIEQEYIDVIEKQGKTKTSYVINTINLYIDNKVTKEKYSIVTEDEVFKIMNYNKNQIDKCAFFRYAITVLDTIYTTTKYGCIPIEKLIISSGISENTACKEYNKYLEDMKVLYIHRADFTSRKEDGTIKKASNTYGRYLDKLKVIEANEKFHGKNYNNTKRLSGDDKRRITAFYNSYVGGTYKESIENLIQMVERYNNDPDNMKCNKSLDATIIKNEYVEPLKENVESKLTKIVQKRKVQKEEDDDMESPFGDEVNYNPKKGYKWINENSHNSEFDDEMPEEMPEEMVEDEDDFDQYEEDEDDFINPSKYIDFLTPKKESAYSFNKQIEDEEDDMESPFD